MSSKTSSEKTVVIVGAGPAGLTAALELLRQTRIRVIVLEASGEIGGISRTFNHHGNRIDIGGHRFFSKSDWVMDWWRDILPVAGGEAGDAPVEIAYQNKHRMVTPGGASGDDDQVMLVRNRLSRIYYDKKFFSYPVKADVATALKLGPMRLGRIIGSYAQASLFPRTPEESLEDFLINRFGKELYNTFFKDYTEKVWGVPCSTISAAWGAQRIKGLNVSRALVNALSAPMRRFGLAGGPTNTSLIERFLYPKYGPGQMWETVADKVRALGGEIRFHQKVVASEMRDLTMRSVTTQDVTTGERTHIPADHVISTMPVSELIGGMDGIVPSNVRNVASGLEYRDFITVGVLLKKLNPTPGSDPASPINLVPDNWIYVQDGNVQVGRLQFFNNWSPWMVADPGTAWVGMEYFCREGDGLWSLDDSAMSSLATAELARLGLADAADLLDTVVLRVPKAYPGYFGSYGDFDQVQGFADAIPNLFLIGRNGMHRYNNQDHSMLTARCAAEAIVTGMKDKAPLWAINIDDDYHEEKAA
jgi:protoporphyrinogen oxidase